MVAKQKLLVLKGLDPGRRYPQSRDNTNKNRSCAGRVSGRLLARPAGQPQNRGYRHNRCVKRLLRSPSMVALKMSPDGAAGRTR